MPSKGANSLLGRLETKKGKGRGGTERPGVVDLESLAVPASAEQAPRLQEPPELAPPQQAPTAVDAGKRPSVWRESEQELLEKFRQSTAPVATPSPETAAAPPATSPAQGTTAEKKLPSPSIFNQDEQRPWKNAPGVPDAQFASAKERTNAWGVYSRTLIKPEANDRVDEDKRGTRGKSADTAPEEMIAQITSIHKKRFYFNLWIHVGKKWASVKAFEFHYEETRHGAGKTLVWLIHAQMLKIWKDAEVCEHLQNYCKNNDRPNCEMVRPHPQIPHCVKATQYKCVVEDWEKESVDHIVQQGIKFETDLDGDSGRLLAKKWVAKSEQLFGIGDGAAPEIDNAGATGTKRPSSPAAQEDQEPAGKALKKSEQELLEKFRQQQAEKETRAEQRERVRLERQQQRQHEKEEEKKKREQWAKTAEGRGTLWVQGLQQHISQAEQEAANLIKGTTALPANLAEEYAVTWSNYPSVREV